VTEIMASPSAAGWTARVEQHRCTGPRRRHAHRPDQLEAVLEPEVVGGRHQSEVHRAGLGFAPEIARHQIAHRERGLAPQRVERRGVG